MKIIKESPEHHFLTTLESLKQDSGGWIGFHFALSRRLSHANLIENPSHIKGKLFKLRKEAEALAEKMVAKVPASGGAKMYLLTDCDIVLLARPQDEKERHDLKALFQSFAEEAGKEISHYNDLAKDLYQYQKMADSHLLGARRWAAYEALADPNRTQSIPLRRQRREPEEKVILIVEDDRFTASYAVSILNKKYDLVHAKTGEEALMFYIEHAPDLVLMDIHLPGLNGHETLEAIKQADKDAYIIMLSVDTVKENVVRASKSGAAGFLKKPFTKERLLHVVMQSPFIKGKAAPPPA
jgi:CheY-like chemotaxis protein